MSKPKKRKRKKVGRPIGGEYPESTRKVWREYQRKRREKLKEKDGED